MTKRARNSSNMCWLSSLATTGGVENNLDSEKKRFYSEKARETLAK